MDFQKRKTAVNLFKEARNADRNNASPEALRQLLSDGNKELLPPDGITPDTDIKFRNTFRNLFKRAFLLPRNDRTLSKEDRVETQRILEIIEITRNQFGVILYDLTSEWKWGHYDHIKDWIYPEKETEEYKSYP